MSLSIWAFDDGYGDNKLYSGEGDIKIIPSYCTIWRPRLKNDIYERNLDPLTHLGVEVEGVDGRFLVGQGALEQSASINWSGGSNKHKDFNFPIIAKACLGILAGDEPKAVVDPLVMGLPVKADESAERHELLKDLMLGTHKVKLFFPDGTTQEKEIVIEDIVAKKQPFGTLCQMILDDKGEIVNSELASQFNVIVDVGTRTLNIYTLDALEPIGELCDTKNQGIHKAYDLVADYIEQEMGYTVPSGSIRNIVDKKVMQGFDLTPVIRHSYVWLSNEIYKILETMFVDSWGLVDNLIFTGGGAELLKDYLVDKFPVEPIFMNRTATVRGLWKYGVRYALKQKGRILVNVTGKKEKKEKEVLEPQGEGE